MPKGLRKQPLYETVHFWTDRKEEKEITEVVRNWIKRYDQLSEGTQKRRVKEHSGY